MKNWKRRYFVLHEGVLKYYTDSSLVQLKGQISLTPSAKLTVDQIGYDLLTICLTLNDDEGTYLIMCAESNDDKQKWIEAIRCTIQVWMNEFIYYNMRQFIEFLLFKVTLTVTDVSCINQWLKLLARYGPEKNQIQVNQHISLKIGKLYIAENNPDAISGTTTSKINSSDPHKPGQITSHQSSPQHNKITTIQANKQALNQQNSNNALAKVPEKRSSVLSNSSTASNTATAPISPHSSTGSKTESVTSSPRVNNADKGSNSKPESATVTSSLVNNVDKGSPSTDKKTLATDSVAGICRFIILAYIQYISL